MVLKWLSIARKKDKTTAFSSLNYSYGDVCLHHILISLRELYANLREAGLQRTYCATCGVHFCYLRWTVIFQE